MLAACTELVPFIGTKMVAPMKGVAVALTDFGKLPLALAFSL